MQFVILKADDLAFDTRKGYLASGKFLLKSFLNPKNYKNTAEYRWNRFTAYIEGKKIKSSLGLIGTNLEHGNEKFIQYVKHLCESECFEIWNHGYDHSRVGHTKTGEVICEFKNTDVEYQISHIQRCQQIAKKKLGIVLQTFGAPENAIDDNTACALSLTNEIKIWFFGDQKLSEKFVIKRTGEIERPLFHPNYSKFLDNYNESLQMLALQIHPASWSDCDFEEFTIIIDFLISKNVTFINPSEYYQIFLKRNG